MWSPYPQILDDFCAVFFGDVVFDLEDDAGVATLVPVDPDAGGLCGHTGHWAWPEHGHQSQG